LLSLLVVVGVLLFLPRGNPMIGLSLMLSLTFLDELAFSVVDSDAGTRLRRAPMSMSSSCWGKRGGEGGGEISHNGDRTAATGGAAGAAATGAGAAGSASCGKL